ncbi:hypothetical protein V8B55DRAFT_1446501 [Mucor lusitanicus]
MVYIHRNGRIVNFTKLLKSNGSAWTGLTMMNTGTLIVLMLNSTLMLIKVFQSRPSMPTKHSFYTIFSRHSNNDDYHMSLFIGPHC